MKTWIDARFVHLPSCGQSIRVVVAVVVPETRFPQYNTSPNIPRPPDQLTDMRRARGNDGSGRCVQHSRCLTFAHRFPFVVPIPAIPNRRIGKKPNSFTLQEFQAGPRIGAVVAVVVPGDINIEYERLLSFRH